jgi:glycolate oxidase FAD binding subunit
VDSTTCFDDLGPLAVERPASVAELRAVVARAAAERLALYPLGGRTMLEVGLPPTRPGLGVDLRALSAVIDYPARDMTVTVQAGITLAELQRLLASENQRLPVDVPHPEQATLGGALAVNVSGPRRYGCGTLRDYVIGLSVVNDDGHEVKAGGRVVKNVAGYDLCKLHIGALGTLGILTQVTLKVRPRPEVQVLLALGCEAAALANLLDRLHAGRARPVCLDVLNARAAVLLRGGGLALPDAPWVVVVGFEEGEDAVCWQTTQLLQQAAPVGLRGVEARAGTACEPLWQALTDLTALPAPLSFKANLLPAATADFCLQADALPEGLLVQAHAGSGIVRGHVSGDLTATRAAAMLKELGDRAEAAQGNLVLPRCPHAWKRQLPVWGRPRQDVWLMRQVKDRFDPHRLFNPGRFLIE